MRRYQWHFPIKFRYRVTDFLTKFGRILTKILTKFWPNFDHGLVKFGQNRSNPGQMPVPQMVISRRSGQNSVKIWSHFIKFNQIWPCTDILDILNYNQDIKREKFDQNLTKIWPNLTNLSKFWPDLTKFDQILTKFWPNLNITTNNNLNKLIWPFGGSGFD